jgi:hypothetical protein
MSKWNQQLLVASVALTICIPALAQNQKLNAPVRQQLTVGSEIERGQDVAFECGLRNVVDFAKFAACINDAVTTNRQKVTLSEPFEFGLYVRALQHSYVHQVKSVDGWVPIWRDRMQKL